MAIELPKLPYSYSALEPFIDRETMKLHHNKHNQAYVDKFNEAIQPYPMLAAKNAETLLFNLAKIPPDIQEAIQNNGGGAANHAMFWTIMKPKGGGEPTGVFADQINQDFGSFDDFKQEFNEAGKKLFGSGWVWVVWSGEKLAILPMPNQDNPLLHGQYPIMGNDVWEHAYYKQYSNQRDKYLENWWNVLNWNEINKRFIRALKFAAK